MISDLGKNIKIFREKLNMSQGELSRKASVGTSTISQIESGKRQTLKGDTLIKVATALNCTPDELLNNTDNNQGDTVKFATNRLLDLLNIMVYADFMELDGRTLTKDEKIILESSIMLGVSTIRYKRIDK